MCVYSLSIAIELIINQNLDWNTIVVRVSCDVIATLSNCPPKSLKPVGKSIEKKIASYRWCTETINEQSIDLASFARIFAEYSLGSWILRMPFQLYSLFPRLAHRTFSAYVPPILSVDCEYNQLYAYSYVNPYFQ